MHQGEGGRQERGPSRKRTWNMGSIVLRTHLQALTPRASLQRQRGPGVFLLGPTNMPENDLHGLDWTPPTTPPPTLVLKRGRLLSG